MSTNISFLVRIIHRHFISNSFGILIFEGNADGTTIPDEKLVDDRFSSKIPSTVKILMEFFPKY